MDGSAVFHGGALSEFMDGKGYILVSERARPWKTALPFSELTLFGYIFKSGWWPVYRSLGILERQKRIPES
jgi:hypothetical protein